MAIEDIDRLKEKIAKDPNSKLFVPLAEEYKKAGMLDEAVDVLTKGLEQQPGYLSARVSLGKIYMERAMLAEAKMEFEKVTDAIPDNLYAHKKLAEIYRELGDKDGSIHEFRTVLKLNPMDEWALTNLAEMEKQPEPEISTAGPEEGELPSFEEKASVEQEEKVLRESGDLWELPSELEETAPPVEDLEMKESVVRNDHQVVEAGEEKLKDTPAGEEPDLLSIRTEISDRIKDDEARGETPAASDEEAEEVDLWKEPLEEAEESPEEPSETPISREDLELWKSLKEAEQPSETLETKEDIEAGAISIEDILPEPQSVVESVTSAATEEKDAVGADLMIGEADLSIRDGKYSEAMNIYKKILSADPDNRKTLQRVEELRSLLKLLGKDKEELIARLEQLLHGIKQRRDEFFGSA
ncbi:MAG: tetratricopeptide repeat protein [Nitrospirota bacterium]